MEQKLLKVNYLLKANVKPITLPRNVRLTLRSDAMLNSSHQPFLQHAEVGMQFTAIPRAKLNGQS